jgi:hypothetical protein
MNKYAVEYVADNKSGSLIIAIKKLIETCERLGQDSIKFKAKDVDINGRILTNLADKGILRIVEKEDCWYQVDEDTMKRGKVNVYLFRASEITPDFYEQVRQIKVDKVEKRIERLKKQLANAYEALNEI